MSEKGMRSGVILAIVAILSAAGNLRAQRSLPPPPGDHHSDRDGQSPYGDRGERGREAALRSCARASRADNQRECLQVVNQVGFLDEAAAEACGSMSFGSNIADCIRSIADRVYSPAEIRLCMGASFEDAKLKCFRAGGRSWIGRPRWERRPDLDSYILERLRAIRSELERGGMLRALADLADLIDFVEQGSR